MPTAHPNSSAASHGLERAHLRVIERRLDYLEGQIRVRQQRGQATGLEELESAALDFAVAFIEKALDAAKGK
jgi:hypothetical protein